MKHFSKYIFVTLSVLFGMIATFFSQKAGGSSSPLLDQEKLGLINIAHADVPVDTTVDPGSSGSGCSGSGSGF